MPTVYAVYTDSLKHKPMTDFPWLAIYDNHGFDPCSSWVGHLKEHDERRKQH